MVDQYYGASLMWGSSRFPVIFGIVIKIGRKWTVDSIFFRPFRPLLSHFKLLKKSYFVTFQLRCPLNWDKSFTLANFVGAKQSIFYLASVLSKGEKRYFRLNKRCHQEDCYWWWCSAWCYSLEEMGCKLTFMHAPSFSSCNSIINA